MPLYEYRCKACGHRFEKIQTFSAPDEKECPVCKGEVERLISAPAVHFSGSGFYSTDYKIVIRAEVGEQLPKSGSSARKAVRQPLETAAPSRVRIARPVQARHRRATRLQHPLPAPRLPRKLAPEQLVILSDQQSKDLRCQQCLFKHPSRRHSFSPRSFSFEDSLAEEAPSRPTCAPPIVRWRSPVSDW
jgi:putative FmdB family regulatory protein